MHNPNALSPGGQRPRGIPGGGEGGFKIWILKDNRKAKLKGPQKRHETNAQLESKTEPYYIQNCINVVLYHVIKRLRDTG